MIYLKSAYLHVIDREAGLPIFSSVALDLSKEFIREFIEKKITKISNAKAQTGYLSPTSIVNELIMSNQDNFAALNQQVVERWYQCYVESEGAPSCDVLIVSFEREETSHLAFLKMDYQTGFTHAIESNEQTFFTDLLMHRALIPSLSQAASEGFLLELSTKRFELNEKKYEFSGKKMAYLAEKVLQSPVELSFTQQVTVLEKTAKKVGEKFSEEGVAFQATVQDVLATSFVEEEETSVEKIAQHVFQDNPIAQKAFIEEVAEKGVHDDMPTIHNIEKVSAKKFEKQKIKLANGIEVIIPIELYRDPNVVEFVQQPDGTLSVILKDQIVQD